MAEYYSSEAVIDFIRSYRHSTDVAFHMEKHINEIPAADARPVVLCRDCDCWNDWDSAGKESLGNYVCSCAHWSVEDGPILYTRPTDFCSYGEKREES